MQTCQQCRIWLGERFLRGTVFNAIGFHPGICIHILAGIWHVDCSFRILERGGRAPKLQTPIGVESARLGAFSMKVRRLSSGACCSREASAAYSAIESAFVTSQVASQRGRSRNLKCEQQASAPFHYGPARGHSFAPRQMGADMAEGGQLFASLGFRR
jgi:hypothetical protein